jgi:outer membrane protein TolC
VDLGHGAAPVLPSDAADDRISGPFNLTAGTSTPGVAQPAGENPRVIQVQYQPARTEDDPEVLVAPPAPDGPFPNGVAIDLTTALLLTTGQNPQVGFAEQRIQEAFAQVSLAEALWLPSLRAGANFNKHEGQIQDVVGQMIETSRGSVYTGMGAMAVGAGSPAVPGLYANFHLRDAVFQPRIARHVAGARMEASRATLNDTLLQTALAYTELHEAVLTYSVAEETLQNAHQLAGVTGEFARTGQGLQADADRARVELSLRQIELRRAAENVRVASARLARLLSQNPEETLLPQEPTLAPIELVESDVPLADLVVTGLSNRPELAESQFLVGEAVQRMLRERAAPLVPSVLLGVSYGGNAGGLGRELDNFGDRLDFDVAAWWELRNLGLGERALRDEAASRVELARLRKVQVLDQVASEVAEAHAQVIERKAQIGFAQTGVEAAIESLRRNSQRIQEGEGLPIEVLQAIQALDQSRRQFVRAVADYNRAQFRLQRALGWPIQ